ncbi:MAG: hypothetical protein A2X42_05140 [Candidatus Margulisbacteria bacterium GWF2_38_17]|nr:MAG: hypothetical protein A2X43_05335 [Candidatus Margulisbacteria bacterium GWD2_39_127]OGI03434.1 MAG: hypothetical protein A2X42_05140 [Candidatus Margulisbacteria bacterium GWF2_38_17]OGI05623.1 MAG: hypothetical protein A2X41_06040 [Candidatus Margulisbacteria bacterium GWE2_39_32]
MSEEFNKFINTIETEEITYDLTEKEKPKSVDISKIEYIKKDANFVDIPFFSFKKKKYKKINYVFDKEKNIQVEVIAANNQYVPTAFDYKVLNVLLKYREYYRVKDYFLINAYRISKELYNNNTTTGGKDLKRITESIDRLKTTVYNIYNKYISKVDENEYSLQDVHLMTILTDVSYTDNLLFDDRVYAISFSESFLNNVKNDYSYELPVKLMNTISNPTAQRLYEVIRYSNYDKLNRLSAVLSYDEIIRKIPLTANDVRNNKKTIQKLIKELQKQGFISVFKAKYPKLGYFYVEFGYADKNTTLDNAEVATTSRRLIEIEAIPYA